MKTLKAILEEVEVDDDTKIIKNLDHKEDDQEDVEEDAPANVVSGIAGLTEPIHPKSVMKFQKRKKNKNND